MRQARKDDLDRVAISTPKSTNFVTDTTKKTPIDREKPLSDVRSASNKTRISTLKKLKNNSSKEVMGCTFPWRLAATCRAHSALRREGLTRFRLGGSFKFCGGLQAR